jgi:hypothetical protein
VQQPALLIRLVGVEQDDAVGRLLFGHCFFRYSLANYENGYKNDFLKAIEPKLQKHKIAFSARGFNIGEELIGEAPKNRIAISVWPSAEAEQSFWDDTHDDFKMAQRKYTTDMWLYALEGVAQK